MTEPAAPQKTWKREVAKVMLSYLAGMFIWGVYEPVAFEAAKFLTLPIFTFAAGAYALDAASKQFGLGKGKPNGPTADHPQ